MQVPVGGAYNLYSTVLDTTAKTLTFSNLVGFDLEVAMIKSIYSSTHTVNFQLGYNIVSCVLTYVAGLQVWTVTFTTIPAGVANGDTLVILLDIPDVLMDYSVLTYIASKS